jgi:hypothetical protein
MAKMDKIVKDLLDQAKDDLESSRKQEARDRLNIYYDNWDDILEDEIEEQFAKETRENVKQMRAQDSNVLKRIVKEISIVYQKEASRSYTIGEGEKAKEDERYNDLMKQIPVNLTLQETNRLTNLCNESLIYIVPRNERIEYDILTPDLVEVYQSETNSKEFEAIVFTQSFVDTKGNTSLFYVYWDIYGRHLKYDQDFNPVKIEDNSEGINPYKDPDNPGQTILPFVMFHKDFPIDSIWNTTGGGDLVSGTKQIGVLLTYLNYLFKVASFKQLVFSGISIDEIPKKLIYDPLFPLVNKNTEGNISTVDHQIDITPLWELIYSKIGALANNYGLSLDNFKLSGDAESGWALQIKNLGLDKIVKEQIKLYRWHELDLFNKTRIVNNTKYKDKISEKGIFKVDFAELQYPENPEDIRKQWKFDIALGAKSITDYAMAVNPDLKTDDDAKKHIEENVEINKTIAEETGVSIEKLLEKAFTEEKEEPLVE